MTDAEVARMRDWFYCRYAELARNIDTTTPDMFGQAPAKPLVLLKSAYEDINRPPPAGGTQAAVPLGKPGAGSPAPEPPPGGVGPSPAGDAGQPGAAPPAEINPPVAPEPPAAPKPLLLIDW
jgi:hypothetical protein